ncbi:MAG: hypothetical protein ABIE94_03365 [archaeon]
MRKLFIFLIIVACILVFFFIMFATRKVCSQDSDCEFPCFGCCCCPDGKESFNKNYNDFANSFNTQSCATVMCAMCPMPLKKPACVENRCTTVIDLPEDYGVSFSCKVNNDCVGYGSCVEACVHKNWKAENPPSTVCTIGLNYGCTCSDEGKCEVLVI